MWSHFRKGEQVLTEVRLVDIFDPVCNNSVGNNEKIKFNNQLSFLRAIIFRIPMPKSSSLTFSMHFKPTPANFERGRVKLRMGNEWLPHEEDIALQR